MAKTESTFKNMLLSLTFITLGASAALGYVYEFTKEPIEISKMNKKLDAIKTVVPPFSNNPNKEMYKLPTGEGDSLEIYPAKKDSTLLGLAVRTYSKKGFSGQISLMAGFKPDGTIINITVLEQKETPGLGTKMAESGFKDQFLGKNPVSFHVSVKKDGGQVDAITAATISSRAFCDAIRKAHNTIMKGGLK
jgi:Na+-translocating ferredoxin:NAD+ oxidoreductase subunit G